MCFPFLIRVVFSSNCVAGNEINSFVFVSYHRPFQSMPSNAPLMPPSPSPAAIALTMKTFDLSLVAIVAAGVDDGAGASAAYFLGPPKTYSICLPLLTQPHGRQSLAVFEVFMLTHVHATCD